LLDDLTIKNVYTKEFVEELIKNHIKAKHVLAVTMHPEGDKIGFLDEKIIEKEVFLKKKTFTDFAKQVVSFLIKYKLEDVKPRIKIIHVFPKKLFDLSRLNSIEIEEQICGKAEDGVFDIDLFFQFTGALTLMYDGNMYGYSFLKYRRNYLAGIKNVPLYSLSN